MNYGLQLSSSGVLTSLYNVDVMANNLANIETVGFKPDMVFKRVREAARQEDNLYDLPSNDLLEKLGGGVQLLPNQIQFTQGTLQPSSNDLDVALEGDGFFVLSSGEPGDDHFRLSRDGRFTMNSDGALVNTNGFSVLDVNDRPIFIDPGAEVAISKDGSITQNGSFVAQLQVTSVADPQALERMGQGLFKPTVAAADNRQPATATVHQNNVERSGVDPITALMGVTDAARSATANSRMIELHDELLDLAVNRFARIS